MKKTLLSIFAFSGLLASAQITDLPLTASQTAVNFGETVQITTTGSQIGYQYYLRDNTNLNNVIVDGPIVGTGNNLTFNTGNIFENANFNVYATDKYALSFSYGNDRVSLGTNNRGIDKEITVAAWIKTASSSGLRNIAFDYSGSNDAGFVLRTDANGKVSIQGRDGTGAYKNSGASITNVTNNQWHYVVGTIDLNTGVWSIYVDGTLENSTNNGIGVSLANIQNLNIGSSFSTTDAYVGEIRDVTFWDKALTTSEISTNMGACLTGSEANIIGHYKLSEGLGTNINDYSSLALNGLSIQGIPSGGIWVANNSACRNDLAMSQIINVTVITGITDLPVTATSPNVVSGGNSDIVTTGSQLGYTYTLRDNANNTVIDGPLAGTGSNLTFNTGAITTATTYNVYGSNNYVLNFTHPSDYIHLTNDNRGVNKEVSVAAWIKTSMTGLKNIVFDYGSNDAGYILRLDANGKTSMVGREGTGSYRSSGVSSVVVTDNQWHYLVGTINLNTGVWSIYVDGALENSTTYPGGSSLANTDVLKIGGTLSSSTSYLGEIMNVSIWDKELSLSEVSTNMTTCLTGAENNLVGNFSLSEGQGTLIIDKSTLLINGATALNNSGAWIGGNGTCRDLLQMTQTATVNVGGVGINELSNENLSVYPNPVKNKLFVELANERVTEINVIDYAGRVVKTINGNVNTVNVSDLTRGIYILKIATENGVSTTRFVKQ